MAELVADYVLKRVSEWGVHRIYGYPGDGINAFLGALDRAEGDPEFIQVRHDATRRRAVHDCRRLPAPLADRRKQPRSVQRLLEAAQPHRSASAARAASTSGKSPLSCGPSSAPTL